jgi:hypothetical protein
MNEYTIRVATWIAVADVAKLIDDITAYFAGRGASGAAPVYAHDDEELAVTFQLQAISAGAAVDKALELLEGAIADSYGWKPSKVSVELDLDEAAA